MTPSKITEGLLHAGFMQLFFNSKKKVWKVLKKRCIFIKMKVTFKALHRLNDNGGQTSFDFFI